MSSDRPGFRPDIEGMRGAAILLVVGFHAGVSWLAGGYVGVDIFFVLSGYLITGLLVRELRRTGDVDLAEFYARRALRLLPALLVVLLATIGIALWLYAPIDQRLIASNGRAVALYWSNVLFAQGAVDYHANSANPFLHTWSLAVEEQFYIIWPLLFVLVGRAYGASGSTRRRIATWVAVAGALSFVASLYVTRVAQPWAFFGMPTRIWEFALGGLVALAVNDEPLTDWKWGTLLQVAGLVAIGIAVLSYHQGMPYPGGPALVPALGGAAILAGGRRAPTGPVTGVLSASPLRWLGRMSYSWYLWHWPLVGAAAVVDWEIGVAGRLAWSAAALGLAMLTYYFVEEPARRGKLFRGRPQLLSALALGASVVAALIAYGAMFVAARNAAPPVQQRLAAARHDGMGHDCWGSLLENATAPCIFGDARASTTVALLGDSHAEHWLPALDRIGRERGWKIVAMVKPACPVADMPELVNNRLKRRYNECTEWRRRMLERIVRMRPAAVVLSSYDHYMPRSGDGEDWQVTPALWRAGLRRTYGMLSRAGINTVVIRGTPMTGFNVPGCLSRRASGAPFSAKPCVYDLARSLSPVAIAAQNDAARGLAHIAFVDMTDRFCATVRCPVVVRGAIVFKDDDHITATFSRAEGPVLGARIGAAMVRLGR
ncbi:MAG: acyltransferase 3 [Gemmatimonadetes bacterium]|nr:acyltransferase 3 [Gemmatimonadota bacterium]